MRVASTYFLDRTCEKIPGIFVDAEVIFFGACLIELAST